MSGTLDLPPPGTFTPPRQKIKSATTPGTPYSAAEKLKIGTPELLKMAKEEQAVEEAKAKKGGRSRRRKGGKKSRKTRRRRHRK